MQVANILRFSDVESKRFGLRIARGIAPPGTPPRGVLDDILEIRPDVAIFRCNAGDTTQIAPLISAGLSPMHADTLVYHRITLDASHADVPPDPSIRRSCGDDGTTLARIVRRSFSGYRNHYHANPLFPAQAILEGYVEWAHEYAVQTAPGKETWMHGNEGFATCSLQPEDSLVEIVLNATDPDSTGRGVYSSLLRFLLGHYRREGFDTLCISTQIWNYRVQRVWARAGLVIDRAYDTYHVNIPNGFFP